MANTDTAPAPEKFSTVEGYEPPPADESQREARARRMRNRRRADKAQAAPSTSTSTSTSTPKSPPPQRSTVESKRAQSVTGVLTGVGIGVMAFDQFDGTTIIEGAPALGDALAKLAAKNSTVAKALDSLTATSALAEVGIALGAIVVPITKHHLAIRAERLAAVEVEVDPPANSGTQPAQAPASAPDIAPGVQVADDAPVFAVDTAPAADPVPTFRA